MLAPRHVDVGTATFRSLAGHNDLPRVGRPPQAYAETHGKDPKCPLQDLLTGADEILSELSPVPEQPHIDCFGFYHAFFRYPAAQAHA